MKRAIRSTTPPWVSAPGLPLAPADTGPWPVPAAAADLPPEEPPTLPGVAAIGWPRPPPVHPPRARLPHRGVVGGGPTRGGSNRPDGGGPPGSAAQWGDGRRRRARGGARARARRAGTTDRLPGRGGSRARTVGVVAVLASIAALVGALWGRMPAAEPTPADAVRTPSAAANAVGEESNRPSGVPVDPPAAATAADPAGQLPTTAPNSAGPSGAAPDTTGARPAPSAALTARDAGRLGRVVVDADGFTLYRYNGDSPGRSTCSDACVSTWQPMTVTATAELGVRGIDADAVGLVRRRDGTVQLTLGGWPLYRFAGDTEPGMKAGHGIGGLWFAVSPTGARAPNS